MFVHDEDLVESTNPREHLRHGTVQLWKLCLCSLPGESAAHPWSSGPNGFYALTFSERRNLVRQYRHYVAPAVPVDFVVFNAPV